MLNRPTVFIVGAGAHTPYGFPTGRDLRDDILRQDAESIGWVSSEAGRVKDFVEQFRDSDQYSIDAFLERCPTHLEVGKRCIASALLRYEKPSAIGEHLSRHENRGNWIQWLMNKLINTATLEEFSRLPVSFITFNYDRYLECYLFKTLRARYGASEGAVASAINNMDIIHVHGSLGRLEWQPEHAAKHVVRVANNAAISSEIIDAAADSIQIVSETAQQAAHLQQADRLLANAELILFLGFGYDALNLRKLQVPFGRKQAFINGTAFEATHAEYCNLRDELFRKRGAGLATECPGDPAWDCLAFLRNCAPLLAQNTFELWRAP